MAWKLWQQHRADCAEWRAVRRYVGLQGAHRALCEIVNAAQRGAGARMRLEIALSTWPASRFA
jgi:hypothetical protein